MKKMIPVLISFAVIIVTLGILLFIYREWTHKNPPALVLEEMPRILDEGGGKRRNELWSGKSVN